MKGWAVPDRVMSQCVFQLLLAIQSLIFTVIVAYWLTNEIMRFIYLGIQRQKMQESNTITEYLKDKSRLNEMDKFNPKFFSQVND